MRSFAVLAGVILAVLPLTASPTLAEGRTKLGYGRLVTNDLIGDGHDRWRSGSVASSRVWGPDRGGALPDGFGRLLELRLGMQIAAPQDLSAPAPGDRPYAGALSLGLHTHFAAKGNDVAIGADMVITGPQTGLDDLQRFMHDTLGGQDMSARVRARQISNDIYPTAVAELGRNLRLGDIGSLRPFAEARAGVETLLRVGADLELGHLGQGALMMRDPVTGQRYRTRQTDLAGYAFVLGADTAYVDSSAFLPASRGLRLSDARNRVRAGLHWKSPAGHHAFYGLTWLDREFKGQDEGQIVGSLRLHIEF